MLELLAAEGGLEHRAEVPMAGGPDKGAREGGSYGHEQGSMERWQRGRVGGRG